MKNVYISDLLSWLSVDFKSYGNPCCNGAALYLNGVELQNITIPSDITEIKPYAFGGCSSITSINLPTSITAIGDGAFQSCQNLENITIPRSVTTIGSWAFSDCNKLKNVYISDLLSWLSVDFKSYGNPCCNGAALYLNGVALQNITIPSDFTEIKPYAFDGCRYITSINLPTSITAIGNGSFRGCQDLENIIIPNSVTSIGNNAFAGCLSFTNIVIPNSVVYIGKGAFSDCIYNHRTTKTNQKYPSVNL